MGLGKPSLPSLSVRGGFLGERPEGTAKEIERNFAVLVGVSAETGVRSVFEEKEEREETSEVMAAVGGRVLKEEDEDPD